MYGTYIITHIFYVSHNLLQYKHSIKLKQKKCTGSFIIVKKKILHSPLVQDPRATRGRRLQSKAKFYGDMWRQ